MKNIKTMNKIIVILTVLLLGGFFTLTAAGVSESYEIPQQEQSSVESAPTEAPSPEAAIPGGLNEAEYEGLLLMREEEKLARDVYLALYDIWGIRIFSNIAGSEETHMNAVLPLLETYGIVDPIQDDTPGVFTDPMLASLYEQLVSQGSKSLTDAFTVGATIEDLDIKDLQELMAETDREDIDFVYGNLLRGSENHMRSFVGQLARSGESYEAQYISRAELNGILN